MACSVPWLIFWDLYEPQALKSKKRPCSGGGEHDRLYLSAPPCVSGGEEARRVLAGVAREEVSAAGGIIGSTREEVGGSETGFIKRRHPGGGGCRHFIVDLEPREEVKR